MHDVDSFNDTMFGNFRTTLDDEMKRLRWFKPLKKCSKLNQEDIKAMFPKSSIYITHIDL